MGKRKGHETVRSQKKRKPVMKKKKMEEEKNYR